MSSRGISRNGISSKAILLLLARSANAIMITMETALSRLPIKNVLGNRSRKPTIKVKVPRKGAKLLLIPNEASMFVDSGAAL